LIDEQQAVVGELFIGGEIWRCGRAGKRGLVDFGGEDAGHVGVNGEQFGRSKKGHLFGDEVAPVAALRDVFLVAEAIHQGDPGAGDAGDVPAGGGWFAGVAVAGHGRDHYVECIGCAAAVGCGVRKRVDDFELFHDGAGPAVSDDKWECVFVFGADVNEVDVEAVDFSDELRQCV
jgi:hypothetical protein